MKKQIMIAVILSGLLAAGGCGQLYHAAGLIPDGTPPAGTPDADHDAAPDTAPVSKRDAIPFEAGQLYAAAYLGYQTTGDLDYYTDRYLDSDQLPVHYVSAGDYYLVIPRYDGMSLSLYVNDIETFDSTLRFRDPDCGPFVIQCNVSDIFADVTVRLGVQRRDG